MQDAISRGAMREMRVRDAMRGMRCVGCHAWDEICWMRCVGCDAWESMCGMLGVRYDVWIAMWRGCVGYNVYLMRY